ncbi:putative AMP-binding enzyme, partial [Aureobasidium melanogenum]|uniref:Putative AMP-binding enzyme n=1 Tax=Aureobasidium melanogenum (strain CBS 110374) TaxID=1043003 RepID=A0A074VTL2_AURM1
MASKSKLPSLQPRIIKSGPYTVGVEGVAMVDGETIPRRHPLAKERLHERPEPEVQTVFDILRQAAKKHGHAHAMGSRRVLDMHTETKQTRDREGKLIEKQWTYYELSDYSYLSYVEFEQRTLLTGMAMRSLGLSRNDRIEIYAATSAFWFTVAHGAISQSITIVTAYDTLGEEGLSHSLKQTNARAIFLDPALLPRITKVLDQVPHIRAIIYNDVAPQSINQNHVSELNKAHPNVRLLSFDEFFEAGSKLATDPVPPTANDLACIMYTSGSTGSPKGVLLKHKNIVAGIAGIQPIVGSIITPGERLLAYLPLAHIIEFVYENAALYWGAVMGYGSPRTLGDSSVRNCVGDIVAFKPSIMVGVPAVWESVRKGILTKVNSAGWLQRKLFWGALSAKENLLYWGLPGVELLDALVFNKVKQATGGNLRVVMNGGGPIAESTLRFISFVICPMLSGYGLTETVGMGALNDPMAWTSSKVGPIPASIEIKLVDVPELDYLTSHQPAQGEIWIRGAAITEGYLDNPEEDAKAFHDGWFKTGDIGEFDTDGNLGLIDRKKNLVKTLNGEYIALEKLESLYRSAPVVANLCVYASPLHAKPIAIVNPVPTVLCKLAKEICEPDDDYTKLCDRLKVQSAVCKTLQSVGKQHGLQGIELIQGVVLSEEEWTPQTGLVTNAQKLNRKALIERFDKAIQKVYADAKD